MRIDGWIGICLLMIHILTCIFVYLGIKSHKIPVKMYIFPLVVFVPVSGLLCCLIISSQIFLHKNGDWDTGTDRLKINEETYKSFLTAPEEEQKEIIPLEEVLIVNDAKNTFWELVKNEFLLSHNKYAAELLEEMGQLFAGTEEYLMLKAELYARLGMGEAFKEQIRQIESSGIYLSHENRETLKFWKGQSV